MIRAILAVVAGFVTWFVVATLGNWLIRAFVPGYVAAEPTMTFTLGMMIARLAVGVVSSLAAGYACAVVARAQQGALVACAAVLVLFFLPVHYSLWPKFPVWYHLFFLITLAPLVLCGGAMYRRAPPAPVLPRT